MAKQHRERLRRKYGAKNLTGPNLKYLMDDIILFNTQAIGRKIGRINKEGWTNRLNKIKPEGKTIIVPDVSDVLPKRSIFIRKAAEDGKLISQRLRDKLTKDLRDTLKDFQQTGKPSMIYQKGKLKGKLNPQLVNQFQSNIKKTFEGYTKRDPKFGMPGNVHSIAVTEIRSVVNDVNEQYVNKIAQHNPEIRMKKTWKQNKNLAKEPRRGHSIVNGKTIDRDKQFEVPLFKKLLGKWINIGYTMMRRPHDNAAPAEQIIGCNCEVIYSAKWGKIVPPKQPKDQLDIMQRKQLIEV